jgi:hypothetical protein
MPRSHIPAQVQQLVAQRAGGQCEYCRCPDSFQSDPYSIDHIVPEVRGGDSHADNLAYCCLGCNAFKGAETIGVDPATSTPISLFNPRLQIWSEHFAWSSDFTEVIGISACGRATVDRMRLNRPGLANLGKALIAFGVHPPAP